MVFVHNDIQKNDATTIYDPWFSSLGARVICFMRKELKAKGMEILSFVIQNLTVKIKLFPILIPFEQPSQVQEIKLYTGLDY